MGLPAPAADRTALVTGASSGIGAEIARALARRRHGLVLVARREDRLKDLAEELATQHMVRAEVLGCDLTDPDARRKLPARIGELGLVVDVLVNNAGFSTSGRVASSDEERELAMIETNVSAVVSLTSLFLPGMVERRRGAILNVASTGAFQPLPGQAGYAASKAFVLSYSEAVHTEVAPFGVTVTALCPGPVKTEFEEVAGIDASESSALPKFMWENAHDVAVTGVEALAAGRGVVIPGLANRVAAHAAWHTPRSILLKVIARQNKILHRA